MPKFITEHDMPDAGQKSLEEIVGIAHAANAAVRDCAAAVQWQTAWVCNDTLFCIDIADSKQAIYDFCEIYGLPPIKSCNQVRLTFDPASVASELSELPDAPEPESQASSDAPAGCGCDCGDECACGDSCQCVDCDCPICG